jgi:hypothetical protein
MNDKKRHHFVPVGYLKGFCDEDEKIRAFLKDAPINDKIHLKPDEIGFENRSPFGAVGRTSRSRGVAHVCLDDARPSPSGS